MARISRKHIVSGFLAMLSFSVWALSVSPSTRSAVIVLNGNDSVQRIIVPASYVAASKHPDLLDVRVVDAQGVAMPMAWIAVDEKQQVTRSTDVFKAYPIMGNASLESRSDLRIIERDGERTVEWSDGNASSPRQQLGVLFDTRSLTADILTDAIVLDADVVAGQPVSLTLASSADLSNWEELTDGATIAQFKNADETLTHNSIKLTPTAFNQRYLRITWPSTSSIKVRGTTLASYHRSDAARQLQKITLALPTSSANNQDVKRNMLWHFDNPLDVVGIEIKTANKQTSKHLCPYTFRVKMAQKPLDETSMETMMLNGNT